jgi:uncharacterized protein YndB with AHSA1/START domain
MHEGAHPEIAGQSDAARVRHMPAVDAAHAHAGAPEAVHGDHAQPADDADAHEVVEGVAVVGQLRSSSRVLTRSTDSAVRSIRATPSAPDDLLRVRAQARSDLQDFAAVKGDVIQAARDVRLTRLAWYRATRQLQDPGGEPERVSRLAGTENQDVSDRIARQIELPTSVELAWRAVTDPDWLALWLADEIVIDPRPGGEARFHIGSETRTGWIEEVRAPEERSAGRLAFWWAVDDQPASRVELTLTEIDAGRTLLSVVESRPLDVLDLVGTPLPGQGGATYGPALVAA